MIKSQLNHAYFILKKGDFMLNIWNQETSYFFLQAKYPIDFILSIRKKAPGLSSRDLS